VVHVVHRKKLGDHLGALPVEGEVAGHAAERAAAARGLVERHT